jgi:pimeloyl-ACP methyl ester carboxylesterase
MGKISLLPVVVLWITAAVAAEIDLPEQFDYMGTSVQTITTQSGRTVSYVDTGPENGSPVLLIGGSGTSAAVVGLTDFLRQMREDLGLRLISVGRAGFGQSDPAEDWPYDDFAADADAVLRSLGVGKVRVLAISGGGPYSAAFTARDPLRIVSVHLAAASALTDQTGGFCGLPAGKRAEILAGYSAFPLKWRAIPPESPTHEIPGFGTAVADDGARAFAIAGQKGDVAGVAAEFDRYCTLPLPDVSAVNAPVFIYQGLKDATVSPAEAVRWAEVYPNVARLREYPDGGHDVQYRHWDQILIDMAGMPDRLVLCRDGKSILVSESEAESALTNGARLGICAWSK